MSETSIDESIRTSLDELKKALMASLFLPKGRFEAFGIGVTFGQFMQAAQDRQWRIADILLGNLAADVRRAGAPETVEQKLMEIRNLLPKSGS